MLLQTGLCFKPHPRFQFFLKCYLSLFLLLMPILNQYDIGPLEPLAVFCVVSVAVYTVAYGVKKLDPLLIAFVLYTVIESVTVSYLSAIPISARFLFRFVYLAVRLYFLFVVCPDLLDLKWLYKAYKICVLAFSAILIFQYILYAATGKLASCLIPDVLLNYGYGNSREYIEYLNARLAEGGFRPSSLFLEPAHFSKYVIPCLGLALGELDYRFNRKDLAFSVFATVGIVLSSSTLGMAVAGVMWFIWLVKTFFRADKRHKTILLTVVALAAVLLLLTLLFVPNLYRELSHKINFLLHPDTVSSFSIRLFRGPAVIRQFDAVHLVFGCGWGNLTQYVTENNITTVYDSDTGLGAVAGYFLIIGYTGLVGFVLYYFYFIKKIWDRQLKSVILIIPWLLILAVAYYVDTPVYLLTVAIMLAVKKQGKSSIYE